jgi:hypothetical protein
MCEEAHGDSCTVAALPDGTGSTRNITIDLVGVVVSQSLARRGPGVGSFLVGPYESAARGQWLPLPGFGKQARSVLLRPVTTSFPTQTAPHPHPFQARTGANRRSQPHHRQTNTTPAFSTTRFAIALKILAHVYMSKTVF